MRNNYKVDQTQSIRKSKAYEGHNGNIFKCVEYMLLGGVP